MAQIYIVVKAAHQQDGAFTYFTTEKAFKEENDARQYLKGVPAVWSESVNGNPCYCERAVHSVELE